jgi:sugar/nucleoside kinase (ribokinase family)
VPRSHPFTAHVPALTNKDGILYDVVGVGNALVDMIAMVDDDFLGAHDMVKGSMALIETDRAVQLSQAVGASTRTSGGSGANTLAGIASLGGDVAFIGKVADDEFGAVFADDMNQIGVDFRSGGPDSSIPTGRCIIAVTPDAQRTMNTFLGISTQLSFSDISSDVIAAGAVLYLEGYLFDRDEAKDAFRKAAEAVELLRRDCHIAAVTRSEKGSVIVTRDDVHEVPAAPVSQVVDTTGAGDLFAAGFLRGLTQGKDLTSCARIGAIAAAEVISHVGPRPLVPLTSLLPADLQ